MIFENCHPVTAEVEEEVNKLYALKKRLSTNILHLIIKLPATI